MDEFQSAETLNTIKFTQGNVASITLYAEDEFGAPLNLAGATFMTQITGKTTVASFDNTKHTIVDAEKGQYTLDLTPTDTSGVEAGAAKDVLSTVTQGGNPITYRGIGVLEVFGPAAPQNPVAQTNIFFGAAL